MIHTYSLNGYNIVLDVCSGAVHVVDDAAFALLQQLAPPMGEQCPA